MDEVSCRALGVVFDALEKRDIAPERLVDGLPISLAVLRDPRSRIDWDLFAELLERFGELCGGPGELQRVGYEHFDTRTFSFMRRVAAVFTRPRDIYWMGTRWFGRALFSNVHASFSDLEDGRLREVLTIPATYRDCPQLFHILRGALQRAPAMVNLPDADVSLELEPRRAIFTVTPPIGGPGLGRRVGRILAAPIAARRLIEELSSQQSRISAQAANLQRINQMGRELAKRIEMDALVDTLARLLRTNFSCDEIALWLAPLEGGPERALRRSAATPGPPTRTYRLQTAGRDVGRLEVWRRPNDADDPDLALLGELTPWIAMALDNARSYAVQREQNELLEARVRERSDEFVTANARLRVAEHRASMGTLAAGIAHEINNPLCSILLAAHEVMAYRKDPDEEAAVSQALDDIVIEAERCSQIVTSVMQLSRNQATEKWSVDLCALARRAAAATAPYGASRRSRIELDLGDDPAYAQVNPIQIEQVIVNLLRNALEAGPGEHVVRVETVRGEDTAGLRIADDGCGISAGNLERIFDPFFTTRRYEGGTGLGLSVVHAILTEHAGTIEVESEEGVGTTVTIGLPGALAHEQP